MSPLSPLSIMLFASQAGRHISRNAFCDGQTMHVCSALSHSRAFKMIWSCLCDNTSFYSSGEAFHKIREILRNLCLLGQKSSVADGGWGDLAPNWCSNSSPRCSVWLRTGLCALTFSTSNPSNHVFMEFGLYTGSQSCWNRKEPSPNSHHKVGTSQFSKMPLSAGALIIPNHSKQMSGLIVYVFLFFKNYKSLIPCLSIFRVI